jgi:uncharacterized protein YndB with AHSA1/START domain
MTTGQKQNLVFTRVFDAPISDVWKAWVEPDLVMRWWGPDGFTAPSVKMDIHEGGASLVCMSHPQFGDQYSLWRYTKIEPQRSIEWIHNLADKDGNKLVPSAIGMPPDFPEDILNRAEFRDLGDGRTELTVTEFDWTVGQMMELSKMGMEQCLNKMAALFA